MWKFLDELKRRNVFRVGAAYAVVGWLIIQIADTVSPYLGLPTWVPSLIVITVLVGFVPALVLTWIYDLTADGLQRTVTPAGEVAARTRGTLGLNAVIILFLVLALGYFVWESRFSASASGGADTSAARRSPAVADKSIAVLPFADYSAAGDQEWFADGLTEEILNSLVRIADFNVASRTSSFAFKDSGLDVVSIANMLGVAHVLEGSVRRSSERLRITAQLIRAADGFHVWSENYDGSPEDVIAIQEQVATAIARALQTAMDPAALAAMTATGTDSIEAYNAYLEGVSLDDRVDVDATMPLSRFRRAVELDPTFAEAHFRLALRTFAQSRVTTLPSQADGAGPTSVDEARVHIAKAIENARDSLAVMRYKGAQATFEHRYRDAIARMTEYLSERPNDTEVWDGLMLTYLTVGERARAGEALASLSKLYNDSLVRLLSIMEHFHRVGDAATGASIARRFLEFGNNAPVALFQAHRALLWAGDVEAAADAARRLRQNLPGGAAAAGASPVLAIVNVRQACAEGRAADAAAEYAAILATGIDAAWQWNFLVALGRNAEAEALLHRFDGPDNVDILISFVPYPHFDPRPFPDLMRILTRENAVIADPMPLPFACVSAADIANAQ